MKNKKGILIVLGIIILLVIILIIVNVTKKENVVDNNNNGNNITNGENTTVDNGGNKVNTSAKLKEDRKDQGMDIKNIQLKRSGMKTIFTANISNTTSSTIKGKLYDIVFVDKTGNRVSSMGLYVRDIEAGKTISIEATIDTDVTECYDFKLQPR